MSNDLFKIELPPSFSYVLIEDLIDWLDGNVPAYNCIVMRSGNNVVFIFSTEHDYENFLFFLVEKSYGRLDPR